MFSGDISSAVISPSPMSSLSALKTLLYIAIAYVFFERIKNIALYDALWNL